MKVINKSTQIIAIIASVAALVLFFMTFATVSSTTTGETISLTGSQMAWKGDVEVAEGVTTELARSTDVWFCFILTLIGALFSALTFKFKGMRYAAPAFSLFAGIYMLVIACSNPTKFVDIHTIDNYGFTWGSITYGFAVWGVTIALIVAAVFGIAHLLVSDKIEVKEGKGKRYTIPQRVVRFFKDYKSEVKKIVWPSAKSVFRNTLIVLVICLIIGAFIWIVDFGLSQLLDLIF